MIFGRDQILFIYILYSLILFCFSFVFLIPSQICLTFLIIILMTHAHCPFQSLAFSLQTHFCYYPHWPTAVSDQNSPNRFCIPPPIFSTSILCTGNGLLRSSIMWSHDHSFSRCLLSTYYRQHVGQYAKEVWGIKRLMKPGGPCPEAAWLVEETDGQMDSN